jgi:hypothetical protein
VLLGGVSLARQDNLVVVGLQIEDEFCIAALVKFKVTGDVRSFRWFDRS